MTIENFLNIRFPTDISYDAKGGPSFNTLISKSKNNNEYRESISSDVRRKYNVSFNANNKIQIDKLINFFHLCKGRKHSFRYKDWIDYKLENEFIGIGDDSNKEFFCKKRYSEGSYSYDKYIILPIIETLIVKNNSSVIDSTEYILTEEGKIIFNLPPQNGDIITVDCDFDIEARFDIDDLEIQIVGEENYNIENIKLVEITR